LRELSIALVHYPVLDASGAIVTTAITNLDVHDLARSARTYGCARYYVVHPISAQRELTLRIREHWTSGSSGKRIPDRKEALQRLEVTSSLDDVFKAMGGRDAIEVWVTAARTLGSSMPFAEARERTQHEGKSLLVVFGTGWGLDRSVVDGADAVLEPIRAASGTGYNHLSVRGACAIVLDRLLGAR
jgi:hypothetical protein